MEGRLVHKIWCMSEAVSQTLKNKNCSLRCEF